MNKLQKRVFLATITLLVAMAIFPPWHIQVRDSGTIVSIPQGYWWITNPPQIEKFGSKINLLTLGVQWIAAIVAGAGLMVYFKDLE